MKLFIKCYYFFHKIDKRFIVRNSLFDIICLDISEICTLTFMKFKNNHSTVIFYDSNTNNDSFYRSVVFKELYKNYEEWLEF